MGLDMYLYRTKKIDGFTIKDYNAVNNALNDEMSDRRYVPTNFSFEKSTGIKGSDQLIDAIHDEGTPGLYTWKSIYTEAGYWRKANQIHKWFVDNVQGGEDDCGYYVVTEENIRELLDTVREILTPPGTEADNLVDAYLNKVIKFDKAKAEELLPTQPGFFFGSYEYDDWYIQDLYNTIKVLEKVLAETDFDKDILIYSSSW